MDVPACALHPRPDARVRRYSSQHPACGKPELSVVIVNYWDWDETVRLVRQLRDGDAVQSGEAEVVIVDNHSPRSRLVPGLRRAHGVSLRRWKSNRGFAQAVNEGCRLSQGDWLLLLNPDTNVHTGFLDMVRARLAQLPPDAGIVGLRLHDADGSVQPSAGRFPDLLSTLTRLLLPRRYRKYSAPTSPQPSEVDWVTGCGLLVRRECLADLGGFDPDFFLYYEDVDLCQRARERGWSVWFDPAASLVHLRPLHSRAVSPHMRLITRHALLTYARKHWPAWQLSILAGVIRLETAGRRLLAWGRGDRRAADTFAELAGLVREMRCGETEKAHRRLVRVVRSEEQHRAATLEHHHPRPQPARSAESGPR